MSGPPIVKLASGEGWELSLTIYPSGPCIEMVEIVDSDHSRMCYSEQLNNLSAAAKILGKELHP